MTNSNLWLITPPTVLGQVQNSPPTKKPNKDQRSREYLTEAEVERLIEACGDDRHSHRNRTLILIGFRHGFRVSELTKLRWDQIDFEAGTLAVTRLKKGSPSTHPLTGRELRMLRKLQRDNDGRSPFVFLSDRGGPMTRRGVFWVLQRAAKFAMLDIKAHPHMLRHGAASRWPTRALTREHFRPTSATRTSSTPFATPSLRRAGSRLCGVTERAMHGRNAEA
jgi:type 1 fimbriae regulatory protein FimB/type 1 fimbriae regulatory protein FimE